MLKFIVIKSLAPSKAITVHFNQERESTKNFIRFDSRFAQALAARTLASLRAASECSRPKKISTEKCFRPCHRAHVMQAHYAARNG